MGKAPATSWESMNLNTQNLLKQDIKHTSVIPVFLWREARSPRSSRTACLADTVANTKRHVLKIRWV